MSMENFLSCMQSFVQIPTQMLTFVKNEKKPERDYRALQTISYVA